jgi:hypothetical protein
MRSASARRGPRLARLWRLAIWTASAALAWPLLASLGTPPYTRTRLLEYLFAAIPVALGSLVTVARLVPAPERRAVGRRQVALSLAHVRGHAVVRDGADRAVDRVEPGVHCRRACPRCSHSRRRCWARASACCGAPAFVLDALRRMARFTSHGVLTRERGAVDLLARVGQGAASPLRDLHTGDAQEYLLFLVGVAVLALLLPLLQ